MIGKFHNFNQSVIRGSTTDYQASLFQALTVFVVKLIAMTMPFSDLFLLIGRKGKGLLSQFTGIRAKTECASHIGIFIPYLSLATAKVEPFFHQINDRICGRRIEFLGISPCYASNCAGKFHHSKLHAQADTQVRNIVLPGILHSRDLALDTGAVVTAGGLSSGLAMALHLVDRLVSRDLALRTARQIDYAWDPERGLTTASEA